jgi:electron transfer flavoprotein alpha subunit
MSGILVLAEHDGGSFKKSATELLGKAKQLAATLGTTVSAVVLGGAPAAELGAFGATKVYQVAGDFGAYDPSSFTDALAAVVAQAQPDVLLAPGSYIGKDVLPRLAARLGTGLGTECTDLRVVNGAVIGRRPLYAGKLFADVTVSSKPAMFTVRPNSFGQPQPAAGSAEVVAVSVSLAPRLTLVERKAPSTQVVDLTEADRIVSGGRCLESAEKFDAVIRPLAKSVRATVGASRAAVDAGIAHHNEQVGQTGKTVNPSLYLAMGISGAIQHLAGMRSSKVIVAVNKDPEAPIFEHATYGIVGDLYEVAPKLAAAFEKALE